MGLGMEGIANLSQSIVDRVLWYRLSFNWDWQRDSPVLKSIVTVLKTQEVQNKLVYVHINTHNVVVAAMSPDVAII